MTKSRDGDEPEQRDSATDAAVCSPVGGWSAVEGQRIWLVAQTRAWQTLAIVPVDQGVSTYDVARCLAAIGQEQGECIGVADLQDVPLNRVPAFLDLTRLLVSRERRVVCALRSIKENLATIPLARAADGVVLCLSLGTTLIAETVDVIAQIGKERLVGSLLLRPSSGPRREPARSNGRNLLGAHA